MPIFLLLATIPSFLCGPLPPTPCGSAAVGQLCPPLSTVESSDTSGGTQGGPSCGPSDQWWTGHKTQIGPVRTFSGVVYRNWGGPAGRGLLSSFVKNVHLPQKEVGQSTEGGRTVRRKERKEVETLSFRIQLSMKPRPLLGFPIL